jgi:RNA polymerase sigma-70 factor (ECF subfamily)
VEAAVARERGIAIEELIDRRITPAYRLARAILVDDAEAEDAVQEAALTAWRQRATLRDTGRFDAWFDRILVNECRDRLRRRKRLREITATMAPPPAIIPTPEDGADIDAALDALDVDHRLVVLLRYWQDRPVDDIASHLGIPPGTVKSRLHYALRELRRRLEASHG